MAAARLLALQGVVAHLLGELEEVRHAAGPLERLVQVLIAAAHVHVVPEFLAQAAHPLERLAQPLGVAGHAALVPHDATELAVERVDAPAAVHRHQLRDPLRDLALALAERRVARVRATRLHQRQVLAEGIGDDEVAVCEPLHERARAQAVRAVVGEVRFADHVQPGDRAHQIVVHP